MNAGRPIQMLPAAVARYLRGEESVETAARAFVTFFDDFVNRRIPKDVVPYTFSEEHASKLHALYEAAERHGIERGAQAYLSGVGDSAFDRVVRLLADDVRATHGEQHVAVVWSEAANALELEIDDEYRPQRCVDNVQQYFQDTFVDTTWPACPLHPNHPLEYETGTWRCPRDRAIIAPLGELGGIAR